MLQLPRRLIASTVLLLLVQSENLYDNITTQKICFVTTSLNFNEKGLKRAQGYIDCDRIAKK
jgi:hypothetical protein